MNIIESIQETLRIEAQTLLDQIDQIGPEFEHAVNLILKSTGKVVVCGMGKSGHVGKKIAATLASTGTPGFFLHPGEAYHGDLGMISANDVILMLSNSGETDELLKIIPFLKENCNRIIAITAKHSSTLAQHADIHLNMQIRSEACPLALAPTSSTTLILAFGDALAIALMRIRKFKADHFARFHPGGSLGKKLLVKVKHKMRKENLPIINKEAGFVEVVAAIGTGRLGLVLVNCELRTIGIVTDGDLRRLIAVKGKDVWDLKVTDFMIARPKTISMENSLNEAEEMLKEFKITSLIAVDDSGNTGGVIQIYDLN